MQYIFEGSFLKLHEEDGVGIVTMDKKGYIDFVVLMTNILDNSSIGTKNKIGWQEFLRKSQFDHSKAVVPCRR